MKQLVVKEILDRMGKGWRVEELYGRDCGDCQSWEEQEIPDERLSQKISIESLKFRIDKSGKRIPVKRPDITFRAEKGAYIWVEVETCKNSYDPLKAVKDKLRHLTEVEGSERPDEIWVVFPYRKYFLYGAMRFERISSLFNEFRKRRNIDKFKPRIFFVDLYNEKLMELELGS